MVYAYPEESTAQYFKKKWTILLQNTAPILSQNPWNTNFSKEHDGCICAPLAEGGSNDYTTGYTMYE
jgi:hypothetical protein